MGNSVEVTQEIADWIMMPVRGSGGFQSFLRKLQGQLDMTRLTLSLDQEDLGKLPQYIGYEPGGFEERLKPLAVLLREQGLMPSE
jgi:hypothetical protein